MAPLCRGSSFCPIYIHLLGVFIPHPLWPLLDNGSKLSLLQREGPTGDDGPMEVQGTEGWPPCLRWDQFYSAVSTPELLMESGWWQAPGETKPLLNIFLHLWCILCPSPDSTASGSHRHLNPCWRTWVIYVNKKLCVNAWTQVTLFRKV